MILFSALAAQGASPVSSDYKKPDSDQLKKILSPEQYAVTQQCGTEPPFQNKYWDNHQAGIGAQQGSHAFQHELVVIDQQYAQFW